MRPFITFVFTVCSRFALLFALTALWLPAWPATNVSGAISVDTVWDDPVYLVTGSVSVIAEVTLTIQPGTVVKFNGARALDIQGQLLAEGTEAEPIHFTDVRDDTVGGDTNGDGDATAPAAGWWRGIQPRDAGSATLAHVSVRYAGHSSSAGSGQAGIWQRGTGALSVTDSLVLDSARDGIRLDNATGSTVLLDNTIIGSGFSSIRVIGSDPTPTITNNVLTGGDYGIVLTHADVQPVISGNTITGTSIAPLGVTGTVQSVVTWDADEVYYLPDGMWVQAGATLTISPGRVIKFNGSRVLGIQGQLLAEGTEAEPIHFTDVRDDTVGGDTNGDGDATAPAAGWWRGIQPRDAGSATLAHVSVRYAGHSSSAGSGQAGIWHQGTGALSVTDSMVLYSARYGIFIENSTAAHSITATRLLNNGLDGIRVTGATTTGLQIAANRIEGSGGNGITLVDLGIPASVSGNQVQANGAHGIEIQNSEGDFHRNVVRENTASGFRIVGANATPHLRRNVVMFNPIGIEVGTGADPLIGGRAEDGNDLAANTEFGVRNSDSSLTINARFNWWGDPSGPFHPEDNPGGLGNEVSDWVDFSDFLDESTYDRLFRDRFEALDNTGA